MDPGSFLSFLLLDELQQTLVHLALDFEGYL